MKKFINSLGSLKVRLLIIMAGIVIGIVIVFSILNDTLFEEYYIEKKQDNLVDCFDAMNEKISDENISNDEILALIVDIYSKYNIDIYVYNYDWSTIYSTKNSNETGDWIKKIIFDKNADRDIIQRNDSYTLQRSYNPAIQRSYVEIYGYFDNGYPFIMQISTESIKENVMISNKFIQLAGIVVTIFAGIIVYFLANRYTKPISDITKIAESMSELNFDVKYNGKGKGEIALLGNSINIMSKKMEQNISELKSANLELQKDVEKKSQIDEMRREFLSNVSHELKTPIALIQGYAEGLKEGISDDPESMDFYCEVIMDEANKMNMMVKKLLTLNQIECGNDKVNMERFNLDNLLKTVIKANDVRFGQNGISVSYDSPGVVHVWGDELQIEEVITNYISNAINHCDYDKKIRISLAIDGTNARVCVFNTGKPIPDDEIDKIWIKFYKVDKARTREYGGNGIGLSIVKAIMDRYNKSYGVTNKDDGVEFWFELDCEN